MVEALKFQIYRLHLLSLEVEIGASSAPFFENMFLSVSLTFAEAI
jgi:hypothetical protein